MTIDYRFKISGQKIFPRNIKDNNIIIILVKPRDLFLHSESKNSFTLNLMLVRTVRIFKYVNNNPQIHNNLN